MLGRSAAAGKNARDARMKPVKTGRKTAKRRTSSKVSRPDVNDDIYEFFKHAAWTLRGTVTLPRFAGLQSAVETIIRAAKLP